MRDGRRAALVLRLLRRRAAAEPREGLPDAQVRDAVVQQPPAGEPGAAAAAPDSERLLAGLERPTGPLTLQQQWGSFWHEPPPPPVLPAGCSCALTVYRPGDPEYSTFPYLRWSFRADAACPLHRDLIGAEA